MSARRRRRLRDERILAAYRRGLGPSAIAQFFDLTPQMIGKIIDRAELEEVEPLSAADAQRFIRQALDGLDQVIEDYAAEYQGAGKHGGYRLGAIRGRLDAIMLRLELQARSGLVPRHLAAPAQATETVQLLTEFAGLLKRHGASDELLRDLQALTSRASGSRRGPRAIEGQAA